MKRSPMLWGKSEPLLSNQESEKAAATMRSGKARSKETTRRARKRYIIYAGAWSLTCACTWTAGLHLLPYFETFGQILIGVADPRRARERMQLRRPLLKEPARPGQPQERERKYQRVGILTGRKGYPESTGQPFLCGDA
jgi:hypothetical protein